MIRIGKNASFSMAKSYTIAYKNLVIRERHHSASPPTPIQNPWIILLNPHLCYEKINCDFHVLHIIALVSVIIQWVFEAWSTFATSVSNN